MIAKIEPHSIESSTPNFQYQSELLLSDQIEKNSVETQPKHQEIDDLNLDMKNINLNKNNYSDNFNSTYNDNLNLNHTQYNSAENQQQIQINPALPQNEYAHDNLSQPDVAKRIDTRRHAVDENFQNMNENTERASAGTYL